MEKEIFQQITDIENIKQAYLDLAQKFDEDAKTARYTGIDGLGLNDISHNSAKILSVIQKELLDLKLLAPALGCYIPKKDGSLRNIYIYTIKDRIKAQAIYRVLEPIFEDLYSPFLFSYRSSHPSYYAARSAVRRYHRHYGHDFIFIADLADYFNQLDHQILLEKLKAVGLSKQAISLLKLFIESSVYKDNQLYSLPIGVIQGAPLSVLFANLYLNDLDKYLGAKASLYRRVGDDLILFDKNRSKLEKLRDYVYQEVKNLKLKIKEKKTKLINSKESFNFLGYHFHDNLVSLDESSIKKIISNWKVKLLSYKAKGEKQRINYLKKLITDKTNSLANQFLQILSQKMMVNDDQQIKRLSEKFFRILTKYLYGKYSARNQRLLKKRLKNFSLPSIYKYYLNIHHGRKTISDLFVSAKKRH